ncbi:MAG: hypothetical protein CM1200mP3_13470 [Chloroflexota bacterium]|nr:MAG: hypothetical protein CM1200mP3_13470 [Chloroflexota bacterium]
MTRPNMTGTIPLLRATGIVKSFGRSRILNQLDISLHPRALRCLEEITDPVRLPFCQFYA